MLRKIHRLTVIPTLLVMISIFPAYGDSLLPGIKHLDESMRVPVDKILTDLKVLKKAIEEIHPDPYAYYPKAEFEEALHRAGRSITEPISRLHFFQLVSVLVAKLRDGHTYVQLPHEELSTFVKTGGKIFPLEVTCEKGRIIVKNNYTANPHLGPGAEITEINGIPGPDIIQRFAESVSGFQYSYRLSKIGPLFSILLWIEYKNQAQFTLKFLPPSDKRTYTEQVKGITLRQMTEMKGNSETENTRPYQFMLYPEDSLCVMVLRKLRDTRAFGDFLEDCFSSIKNRSIKRLLIDIRENGGGDSRLGEMLLTYLTGEPFRQVLKTDIKISGAVQSQIRKSFPEQNMAMEQNMEEIFKRILKADVGEKISIEAPMSIPEKKTNRFGGDVCLLIGRRTFSSAVILAAAFQDHHIGLVAGDETGGLASHFGEPIPIELPSSKLKIKVSSKYFIRPSGAVDTRGVIPDIPLNDPRLAVKREDPLKSIAQKCFDFFEKYGPHRQHHNSPEVSSDKAK